MELIAYLLWLAVIGLIVGALGRLIVPGPDPMGILGTILVGLAGAFLAGLVARGLWGSDAGPGLLLSVLGAGLLVWLLRGSGRRTRV